MRIRSWLAAILAAIVSLFGFFARSTSAGNGDEQRISAAAHRLRSAGAARELREFNRSRYAVVPPFHKVKGKTRGVLRRPQTIRA